MVLSTVCVFLNLKESSALADNWMIADCRLNPPGQLVHDTLSQKYQTQKRAGGLAPMIEHLPKNESLCSNLIMEKNPLINLPHVINLS
jgi:hypothetical protein